MTIEMNCSPTPRWATDFKKEIIEEFNVSRSDAIYITGKMEKVVRKQKREWLEKAFNWFIDSGVLGTALTANDLKNFLKTMEEQ